MESGNLGMTEHLFHNRGCEANTDQALSIMMTSQLGKPRRIGCLPSPLGSLSLVSSVFNNPLADAGLLSIYD